MMLPYSSYEIALGLISIMISISGILIGIGIAIDDRKLKELGKEELYQAFISGAIVGILFALLAPNGLVYNIEVELIKNTASMQCTGAMSSNYAVCFAYSFLAGGGISMNGVSYHSLLSISVGLALAASAVYGVLAVISSISISIAVISFSFSALLQPLLHQLSIIIGMLTMIIVGIEIQAMLLQFVAIVALPVLLPTGIVLRCFYFTRRLGGAIIALSVALLVVFPMAYLLNAQMISTYSSTESFASLMSNAQNIQNKMYSTLNMDNATKSVLWGLSNDISNFASGAENAITSMFSYIASIIVEVVFLPTFSIILTIISAREIARILGSEITFGKFDLF